MLNYSQNELEFFRTLLFDYEIRVDGRTKIAMRDYSIVPEVLPSCLSSLKMSYLDREILFAIKGEIVTKETARSEKLLQVTVDSMYKREKEDAKVKKQIEDYIETLLLGKIDKEVFRINKNFDDFYWKLYVDIYIFDVIKMSLLQLLMIGVKSALKTLKLPRLVLFTNEITGEKEFDLVELYEDVSEREKESLLEEDVVIPDVYVFAVLNNNIFLDPTEEEFSIASSIIIISSYKDKITNVQSIGSSADIQKLQDISSLIKSL